MQVILGSGGSIARPLAIALAEYTDHVRCCSRSPHALPTHAITHYEHQRLDLLERSAVVQAVEGAEVAYLTAGLAYDLKVWQRDWPLLIDNVLAACAKTGCKLAFFDNVYAYAKTSYAHMTEDAPQEPPSRKGLVRAAILKRLWAAHRSGKVEVTVGRAADFYGPGQVNGLVNALVIEKLAAESTPQWLGDAYAPHSFTYTPDAGRHFALLGNADQAYGEAWHLPTAASPWTPREWASKASALFGRPNKLQVLPNWLYWTLAKFNGQLRELYDVRDQHAAAYVFDSSKFEQAFDETATPYEEGLKAVVDAAQADA